MEATRKGTLSDAIEAVTTLDIVEAFDIPHKTKRGRTYILCPGHDDKHFGSCYIDKNDNGYYCYVCGKHVTKWEMALMLHQNNKLKTCEWFFNISGITPTETKREDPYKKVVVLIRQLEQYIRNDVVYNDTHVCNKCDSSYGRNINGEYMYSTLEITNPMLELYKTNKNAFKALVTRILNSRLQDIRVAVKSYQDKADDCFYIETVGLIPNDDMAHAGQSLEDNLKTLIAKVNEL
jgi:hypothetical protein